MASVATAMSSIFFVSSRTLLFVTASSFRTAVISRRTPDNPDVSALCSCATCAGTAGERPMPPPCSPRGVSPAPAETARGTDSCASRGRVGGDRLGEPPAAEARARRRVPAGRVQTPPRVGWRGSVDPTPTSIVLTARSPSVAADCDCGTSLGERCDAQTGEEEYGGGSWTIERADGSDDQADINDVRAFVGMEWMGPRGVTGFADLGYAFEREVVYRSDPRNKLDVEDGLLLRLGFAF